MLFSPMQFRHRYLTITFNTQKEEFVTKTDLGSTDDRNQRDDGILGLRYFIYKNFLIRLNFPCSDSVYLSTSK